MQYLVLNRPRNDTRRERGFNFERLAENAQTNVSFGIGDEIEQSGLLMCPNHLLTTSIT
jgi:hypothetical protein